MLLGSLLPVYRMDWWCKGRQSNTGDRPVKSLFQSPLITGEVLQLSALTVITKFLIN